MKTVAIIESRMTSKRLPGKNLKDIEGKPMLARLIGRLRQTQTLDQICLATSTDPSDDSLETLARQEGIACFRGSLEDVMDRTLSAAKSVQADVIVEITGDCPLVCPLIIDAAYRVPHAVTCTILGVSVSWLYKWLGRGPTERQSRRAALDKRVAELFERSKRTYGSPRIHADLLDEGWRVSVNTVADSMRRQGLQGRKPKRPKGLTKQDKKAPKFPDLLRRDFSASASNCKWCGDITEIPTDEGKLYLASVLDLCGRRLLACPMSEHPDVELAGDAIKMAAAVRGGRDAVDGVIFHADRGSTYTANDFTALCLRLGIRQSMGRVGSCFDNAASEAFFSTLEHEVLSRHHFATKAQARAVITAWCHDFYNTRRRHSSAGLLPPIEYEKIAAIHPEAA